MRQLFKKTKSVALTEEERREMRGRLVAFMRQHPVQHTPRETFSLPAITGRFAFLRQMNYQVALPALLLAFLIVGGATVYASQSSIPGDTLYPIKVGLAEPLREVLAFSDEAKSRINMELATERLEEAEALSLRGAVSEETQEAIQKQFRKSSAKAVLQLEKMKESPEKEQLGVDFQERLETRADALVQVPAVRAEGVLVPLIGDVRDIAKSLRQQFEKNPQETLPSPPPADLDGGAEAVGGSPVEL